MTGTLRCGCVFFIWSSRGQGLQLIYSFLPWPHCLACGVLDLRPGTEAMPPAVEAQSLNHWTAREISSSLLLQLQSLDQWLALIMKNWYYFYGACSLTVWWINKWSPSSSSYLKHHVLNHMKTIMSNKRDRLMPSLSLFAPFLSAFHWFLSIFPLDASDVLSTNRKEHTQTHTQTHRHTDTQTHRHTQTHILPITSIPANAADSAREAITCSQVEQTSH